MMETRDYANMGCTTWRAVIWLDDGNDPCKEVLSSAERPNKGLIKAWVNQTLPKYRVPAGECGGIAWARVERGTWIDESFDDPDGHGHVHHASWENSPDDVHRLFAYLDDNGADVTWDDPSLTAAAARSQAVTA